MAPKNTASFVFTEVTNSSGWADDGVSWLVGLLSAVYPFLGYALPSHSLHHHLTVTDTTLLAI